MRITWGRGVTLTDADQRIRRTGNIGAQYALLRDAGESGETVTASEGAMHNRSKVLFHIGVLGSYALFSVLLTYPLILNIDQAVPMPTYIHDHPWVHSLWGYLWWIWYVKHSLLVLHQIPAFTNYVFYPVGINCISSLIQCIFPALFFVPLVCLLPLVAAGNVLLLLSLSMCAYLAFLLARFCLSDNWAAYIVGLAFGFCSPQMANAQGHLLVMMVVPLLPLFILFFVKAVTQNDGANVYLLFLVSVALFFSYWYFVVFALLFSLVYLLLNHPNRAALFRLLKSFALACLVVLPVAAWLAASDNVHFATPLGVPEGWSVDLLAFFIPSPDHPVFGDWAQTLRTDFLANPTIQSAYVGWSLIAIAMVGIFTNPWRDVKIWVVGFLGFSALSLGPVLHIDGKTLSSVSHLEIIGLLPFAWFHKIPVFNAIRDCSMFLIIASLCMALIVGFGVKGIRDRFPRRQQFYSVLITLVVLFDLLIVPFPLFKFKVPSIYAAIKQQSGRGTLVDVPLQRKFANDLFYQTIHEKRLLLGEFSRMLPFYDSYAKNAPIIELFENPQQLVSRQDNSALTDRLNAQWAVDFFDIDSIVVHRNQLTKAEWDVMNRFIKTNFHVLKTLRSKAGDVGYLIGRPAQFNAGDNVFIDFGAPPPQHYLQSGWGHPENWGPGLNVCWSDQIVSHLYVDLKGAVKYSASMRLKPFSYPGCKPQEIKIYVNHRFLTTLVLKSKSWKTYHVEVPASFLVSSARSVNDFEFVYGYVARPSEVIPDSKDSRQLGVAFDYIKFSGLAN